MSGRALLASPFGFLIGMSLGALGGGGSILAVPALVFVAGQTPSEATSTSLLVVGVASVVGAVGHWRRGRVHIGPGVVFGLLGVAGSLSGSALNRRLDGDVLLLAFASLILIAAWRIAAGCPGCTRVGEPDALQDETRIGGLAVRSRPSARAVKLVGVGTVVGFLTGLFGVGGGFVIVPALTLILGYSMPQAVGTSLVVIAVNTGTAFAAHLGGSIDWSTTLLFTTSASGGVAAGTRIADRIEPRTMQRAFATLLVAVALYTGGRAVAGIW
jgi:uncharacterized protein